MSETIIWRLHLASSPEKVHDLLSTDEGRSRFWAESAVEKDAGIDFEFINGMGGICPVIANEPPSRFEIEYFGSHVRFDLAPDGAGGTDLKLSTWGFSAEDRDHVLPGWLNVLFPLKAWADHGIDLHNHDPERTWEQRYVDH